MREIIRKERKLYFVLHFCAFCYGACIAVLYIVLGFMTSVEIFSAMQDFYRQTETSQSIVAGFMLVGILLIGLAMLYGYVGYIWFKTFFSNFEHKCAVVYKRYNHWPLYTGFWVGFVVTIGTVICVCVLAVRKYLFLPVDSAEKLQLILIVPFNVAALCMLLIGLATSVTQKTLRRCYKRLGYDI